MSALDTLRKLGPGEEAPAPSKERVQAALFAAIAASSALGTGAVPKAASVAPSTGAPLIGGIVGSKAIAVALGIWLIGGASGAALYRSLHEPEVRIVYVDRSVFAPVPTTSVVAPSAERAGEPVASPAPTATAVRARVAPAVIPNESALAIERGLLDRARTSASRGEPDEVLRLVGEHEQRFPRGRLLEEREALAIRALLALGRGEEARARASSFRSDHPRSFLLPMIDSALASP